MFLYAFDLLHLAGHDTTALPLHARRRLLRNAVGFHGPLRLTPSRKRDGERFYSDACRQGWEGLIAKRADAPYTPGRSRDWLKFKCSSEQELVIGGYTAPRGSRSHLGALLLGYYEDGRLRYAGKVGTGFTEATLADLSAQLVPLQRDTTPFDELVREPHVPGSNPVSWRRSASASGRETAACAIPATSGSVTTRSRRKWCASAESARSGEKVRASATSARAQTLETLPVTWISCNLLGFGKRLPPFGASCCCLSMGEDLPAFRAASEADHFSHEHHGCHWYP